MAEHNQLKKILVVCTGNTCRSPMAEGWLNAHLKESGWIAESAGVMTGPGGLPSAEAVQAMAEIKIDISAHRSRPVTRSMLNEAAVILTMTEGHWREIIRQAPEAEEKTFLVHSFGLEELRDVVDPYGLSIEAYRHTRDELAQALGEFLLHLAERGELKS